MSGVKANPQDFDSLNRSLKRSVDLRDSTKAILRASEKWNEAGRSYSVDMTDFAEKMLKFVTFVETNEELVTILRYFGKTMKAISQEGNQMMERCGRDFSEPLAQFIENDFIATAEAKKRVDKAMSEYESTLANVKGGITKHNAIDQSRLLEFTQEMERLREGLNQKRADLASRLDKIDVKVEQKLLSYLYDLMASQHQYFIRGCEIFKTIKPRMDQMKLHIDQVAATREKEVVSTKEGYLLHMNEKNRVKNKWMRNWYVLRDGLFYCKVGKEVDNDSVLDIVLCTVRVPVRSRSGVGLKEAAKHKFEIMTPGKKKPIVFAAETEGDRKEWVAAIQEAISQSLNSQALRSRGGSLVQSSPRIGTPPPVQSAVENRGRLERHMSFGGGTTTTTTSTHDQEQMRYLNILRSVPGNDVCADCRSKEPEWASINLGILICLECSGVHRSLGTHISKVRSLTLDKWDPELLIMMKCLGNTKSNKLFEAAMSSNAVPHLSKITPEWRRKHIKAKYAEKVYFTPTTSTPDELSEELYSLVSNKEDAFNVAKFIMLMYQGANVNWPNPNHEHKTPLHRAVELDNIVYVEALTQNGGSPFLLDDRGWTAMHYAAYFNHVRCLSLLLKRGCKGKNDLLLDTEGRTTLQVAEQYRALDCEQLLRAESLHTPKTREANGKHEEKNGAMEAAGGVLGSARSESGGELTADASGDEAKAETGGGGGGGGGDDDDGETSARDQRNSELDLRNRTLMTVEDVEKERCWECLQHFLTMPKKDLPEVTEQGKVLAQALREPQKSKSITQSSGSDVAIRNQSWASDDSVRTSSSESKDTKRTRRLSLNLSLISAVHKGPSRKSGRENGASVVKTAKGTSAGASTQAQPAQSLSQSANIPAVSQTHHQGQQRGINRAATSLGLSCPSPSAQNSNAAQPWLQEDYWEDSSKTSTDEDDDEEYVASSDSDPGLGGLRKASSVDALPISPKNNKVQQPHHGGDGGADGSGSTRASPKTYLGKLHASLSSLPTSASQTPAVVASPPSRGTNIFMRQRSSCPSPPKSPSSSSSSSSSLLSSSPPTNAGGTSVAGMLADARKDRKTKKPVAPLDSILIPNSPSRSGSCIVPSPRHGSPPSAPSPLAAMSHRSSSLRNALSIGDMALSPPKSPSSVLSGGSPPDQRRPSGGSLSKATARKTMASAMSYEYRSDDAMASTSGFKPQSDRKLWKKEDSKLDRKQSTSFDAGVRDAADDMSGDAHEATASVPTRPTGPPIPAASDSPSSSKEPPAGDTSAGPPSAAEKKNRRKTFLGFAMTKSLT